MAQKALERKRIYWRRGNQVVARDGWAILQKKKQKEKKKKKRKKNSLKKQVSSRSISRWDGGARELLEAEYLS